MYSDLLYRFPNIRPGKLKWFGDHFLALFPTVSQPDITTVSQPDITTVSQPDITTVSQPDITAVSQPDITTVSQPEITIVSQTESATVATVNNDTNESVATVDNDNKERGLKRVLKWVRKKWGILVDKLTPRQIDWTEVIDLDEYVPDNVIEWDQADEDLLSFVESNEFDPFVLYWPHKSLLPIMPVDSNK